MATDPAFEIPLTGILMRTVSPTWKKYTANTILTTPRIYSLIAKLMLVHDEKRGFSNQTQASVAMANSLSLTRLKARTNPDGAANMIAPGELLPQPSVMQDPLQVARP